MELIKLKIVEFRIPITREANGDITENLEKQVESDSFNLTLNSPMAIGEEARKISDYNNRQLEYVNSMPERDFILKRIIINNQ